MKIILIIILVIFLIKCEVDTSKMLIIFFSRTGNTALFCDYIKEILNIDSYRIIPVNEYPSESQTMTELAKMERNNNVRPEIIDPLQNITKYNKILLGYPIWNSYMPCIVINQLLKINFSGKIIYPFITHEGSEEGNSINDIKLYSPGAIVKKGLSIKGSVIKNNKEYSKITIKEWLNYHFGYEYNFYKKVSFKFLYLMHFIYIL